MKIFFIAFLSIMLVSSAISQETVGGKVAKRAKDRTYQRGEDKGVETVDKVLDEVEDGILNIFKKKKKKETTEKKEVIENKSQENIDIKKNPIILNSKFDFKAGEKELYFDNFERLDIGDFPAEFNTNASGEIVVLDNKEGKWLNMTKNGFFIPEKIRELPENFTLEFEVGIHGTPGNSYSGFGLNFNTIEENLYKDNLFSEASSILYLHPGAELASIQIFPSKGVEINNDIPMPQWNQNENQFAKVSIWRQKGRLRVYLNEDKLTDIPRFFNEKEPYSLSFFRRFFEDCDLFISNIRFAVAGADMRNKLITEGRFVTNGILFEVNSENIKPESGAVLKEIATTLQENPTIRVKIIGHTDSDGSDIANLSLSQKRANAVKIALSSFYGIDISRFEIEGKGESQPLNKNLNEQEKAMNRRVEFIKL